MNSLPELGKLVVILGVVLVVIGLLMTYGPRIPFLGKLPGDIVIRRENFTLYLPLGTCILLSVLLSLIFRIFRK